MLNSTRQSDGTSKLKKRKVLIKLSQIIGSLITEYVANNWMYLKQMSPSNWYSPDKVITISLSTSSQFGITKTDRQGKQKPKHAMTDGQKQFVVEHIRFNLQISPNR